MDSSSGVLEFIRLPEPRNTSLFILCIVNKTKRKEKKMITVLEKIYFRVFEYDSIFTSRFYVVPNLFFFFSYKNREFLLLESVRIMFWY